MNKPLIGTCTWKYDSWKVIIYPATDINKYRVQMKGLIPIQTHCIISIDVIINI
jgi:hypothetical protein